MRKWNLLLVLLLLFALLLCGCKKSDAQPYTVTDDWGTVWEINPAKGTIKSGNSTYKFKIRGDQQDYTIFIDYPNNNRYTEDKIGDELYGNYKMNTTFHFWTYIGSFLGVDVYYDPPEISEADGAMLTEMLYPLIPEEAKTEIPILPLVLIALGCADILWPKYFWFFRYGTSFREVTPSQKAQLLQNLAGVAAIVIGIVLLFA